MFIFEAIRAKNGDSLLIHHGSSAAPEFVLIDGGPAGVYRQALKPRLTALRDEFSPDASLNIGLVMISHIDHDHIDGIIDLFAEINEARTDHETPLVKIEHLWNNSFDDLIPKISNQKIEAATLTLADLHNDHLPDHIPGSFDGQAKLVLQSVREGIALRDLARANKIDVNAQFENAIVLDSESPIEYSDLNIQILGPSLQQVEDLRKRWDKEAEKLQTGDKKSKVQAAEYLDKSVFNLSSIVALIQQGDSSILTTGDARGDFILEALERAELFVDGVLAVDVLKLPHHGSDRNIEKGFFEKITAKHYVISGNGRHHNPEANTFQMLFDARPTGEPYTLHLTYGFDEFKDVEYAAKVRNICEQAKNNGVPVTFNSAQPGESITIEL